MKIQTMSIVVGGDACNAKCPFCIAKMTNDETDSLKCDSINFRNLDKAILLAKQSGITTCILTGKGEPTLYIDEITEYLHRVGKEFPFIELQTNGLKFADNRYIIMDGALKQ